MSNRINIISQGQCKSIHIKALKERTLYIEVLRVFAMMFVIYNHTGSEGYFYFASFTPDSIKFWIYLFITIFCAFAVPSYFAITGAFVLENASFNKKLFKRIIKILLITIAISLMYYLKDSHTKSVSEFFRILFTGTHKYHLWFLYSYIAFLISSPFIKGIVKSLSQRECLFLFGLCIFFQGIIPTIQQLATHTDQIFLINSLLRPSWIFTNIVIYPIFGYWIHNKINENEINGKTIGALWIANCICIAISSYLTLYKAQITGFLAENNSQTYFTCFTLLNMITVYITIKYICRTNHMNYKFNSLVLHAGKASLYVYLFHPLVKDSFFYKYIFYELQLPRCISIIIYVLATYSVCWLCYEIIAFGYKKINRNTFALNIQDDDRKPI